MSRPTDLPLPPAFDPSVYRSANRDLAGFADSDLVSHYERFGRDEGRVCSVVTGRASFVAPISAGLRCLEIGPFNAPCLDPRGSDFVDVRSTEELRARAVELGLDPSGVPEIRWVSPDGRLSVVTDTYDVVLSSHAIEHQVDLVAHLREVSGVLEPGGHYFCVIPDSRYCFDHFLAPSTIADVLSAHSEGRSRHSLGSVIEHWAMTGHNDPARHWAGDHGVATVDMDAVRRSIDAWRDESTLLDVHAWQFTPDGFAAIIDGLGSLGLTDLELVRLHPTLRGTLEFYAVLRRRLSR